MHSLRSQACLSSHTPDPHSLPKQPPPTRSGSSHLTLARPSNPHSFPSLAPRPHPPSPSSGSHARPGLRGLQKAAALARAPQECATDPHYSPARGGNCNGNGGGAQARLRESRGAARPMRSVAARRAGQSGGAARGGPHRGGGCAAARRRAQAGRGGATEPGRLLSLVCSARTQVRPDCGRSCGSGPDHLPERGAQAQSAETQARAPPPAPPGSAGAGPGRGAGPRPRDGPERGAGLRAWGGTESVGRC